MVTNLIRRPEWAWPVTRFEREMGSLLNQFFGPPVEEGGLEIFTPQVNLAETEKGFEVTMELPGMKAEDVQVELKNGELWVSGEKKVEKEEKGKTYHRIERRDGRFTRTIPLPVAVKETEVAAEYKDGILRIAVPKAAAAVSKKIEVKT